MNKTKHISCVFFVARFERFSLSVHRIYPSVMNMKSWLIWVLVASEIIILFSSGFFWFAFVLLLGFGFIFKNAAVCAGYVDF